MEEVVGEEKEEVVEEEKEEVMSGLFRQKQPMTS